MDQGRIRNLNSFFNQVFGTRVHKVSLRGGFTCPNRDGSVGTGGCSFCNPAGSRPMTFIDGMSIKEQLEAGCRFVASRYKVDSFLAYFQDYSTTYADPEKLSELYSTAIDFPGVVGLALCTRPDCLNAQIMDLLEELSGRTFLWVELGVQTSNDSILEDMNRCHTSKDTLTAMENLHSRNILTTAQMIIGYPGSDDEDTLTDAEFVRKTGTSGLKLQNLHVVKDTELERMYLNNEFDLMTLDKYIDRVITFLEYTEPGTVIQRLTGEAHHELTVAPKWSLNKQSVVNRIHQALFERDSWQGRKLGYPRTALDAPFTNIRAHWNLN
ncbi:MAG: TIGR01212 family radical SAM protein [Candidatus Aegiribacteria sp.]|nr:TIGR01212 family radical SAM protein [Candidatus Aegiribacteria sp.]